MSTDPEEIRAVMIDRIRRFIRNTPCIAPAAGGLVKHDKLYEFTITIKFNEGATWNDNNF